eukprot:scaffold1469_cov119-Cylindrotheca_fusiformis.AAC.3
MAIKVTCGRPSILFEVTTRFLFSMASAEEEVETNASAAPETPAATTEVKEDSEPDKPNSEVGAAIPAEKESVAATSSEAVNDNSTSQPPSNPSNATSMEDSTAKSDGSTTSSKGAQILLNRFSSWKQSTQQNAQELWKEQGPTLQQNAKRVWKQAPVIPLFSQKSRAGNANNTAKEDESMNFVNMTSASPEKKQDAGNEKGEAVPSSIGDEGDKSSPDRKDGTREGGTPRQSNEDLLNVDVNSALSKASVAASRASKAASKASAAATVVAESVATNFRGRYNVNNSGSKSADTKNEEVVPEHPSIKLPESQTELILKSRVGEHMQAILDKLEPHQFAMLLGRGMLGVNLKQCYLKNHGVFIDYLVQGGQAEQSRIVRSGDLIVTLGDIDLRKQTIIQIPQEIAKARRPSVLVFAQGTPVALERMNYLDIVVAMMHRARYLTRKNGNLDKMKNAGNEKEESKESDTAVCENAVPLDDTGHSYVTPPAPTLELRKEFADEVAVRCNDDFDVDELLQVASIDAGFRAAIRNAFLTCALDGRRLPFLARHLSDLEEVDGPGAEGKLGPSARFMLFLELVSFLDLYHVTPHARLKDMTTRIAYKFFLPTSIGPRLQPPLFDFHNIVPDSSLRHLEFVLSGKTPNQSIPKDVFLDFLQSVVDSLTGAPFLSFLTSNDCARMRAYLRNTAPYVNVPLGELIEAIVKGGENSVAKNCFTYILIFLICQLEKEHGGEHKFNQEEQESKRILGASNDICCSIFIKRTLVPTLTEMKESLKVSKTFDEASTKKIVTLCEKFWDVYIVGTLELSAKSDEIETSYNQVRSILDSISQSALANGKFEMNSALAESIANSNLLEKAQSLADELLYNYAANVHTKFREHKIHEWMCNELAKVRANDPIWSNKQEIPNLSQGCVKRLLRKAELPDGVSSHKPFKASTSEPSVENGNQNAEYAVVFGTSSGPELASQMPIPGIESSDIRRYTCLPVALDREQNLDSLLDADKLLPPTFESYAVVPPSKTHSFAEGADEMRLSVDGWEVSLVSFSIPNAESSGDPTESSLFGVSLVFVKSPDVESEGFDSIQTDYCCEEASLEQAPENSTSAFESPITFAECSASPEGEGSDTEKKGTIRKVKVCSEMPILNEKLKAKPWLKRVQDNEFRDNSNPITIGLALVSHRSVILAMRNTLSRLLFDYSRGPVASRDTVSPRIRCGDLIDVLGSFSSKDVEPTSLRCILEPYLRAASATWIDRPIADQAKVFETQALQQLTECLPPTPLALMFATALLEQKIVLSSSRRSVLLSATVALQAMLQPLKWSHLLVPLVPASLASDLIQYPAPFILGVPSQDVDNMGILGSLPADVTLVDLDVGRVILAPSFGQDNEMVRKSLDTEATAKALRSQILYLAHSLGRLFGIAVRPDTWCCDAPSLDDRKEGLCGTDKLLSVSHNFIEELLEGVASCCYWIEEASFNYGTSTEPTDLTRDHSPPPACSSHRCRYDSVKSTPSNKRVFLKPIFLRKVTSFIYIDGHSTILVSLDAAMSSTSQQEVAAVEEEEAPSLANRPTPSSPHETDDIRSSPSASIVPGPVVVEALAEDAEDASLPRWRSTIQSLLRSVNFIFIVLTYPFMVILPVIGLLVVISLVIFPFLLFVVLVLCWYYCFTQDPVPLALLIRSMIRTEDEDAGQSSNRNSFFHDRSRIQQVLIIRKLLKRQSRNKDEEATRGKDWHYGSPVTVVTEHMHLEFSEEIFATKHEDDANPKDNSSSASSADEVSNMMDEEIGIALQSSLNRSEQDYTKAPISLELPTGSDDVVQLPSSSSNLPKEGEDGGAEELSDNANGEDSVDTMSGVRDRGTTCDICFMDYEVGDLVAWSPNPGCTHCFHKECILDWLEYNITCPNCRKDYLSCKENGGSYLIRGSLLHF